MVPSNRYMVMISLQQYSPESNHRYCLLEEINEDIVTTSLCLGSAVLSLTMTLGSTASFSAIIDPLVSINLPGALKLSVTYSPYLYSFL